MSLNLRIDPLKLEEEWQRQPELYGEWAYKMAEAQADYDEQKSSFDVIRATVNQEIRESPDLFNIGKITETAVVDAATLDPRMKAANIKLNRAKKDLALAKAAVDALEHRKRALTMLVELWVKDYYSELSVSKTPLDDEGKRALRNRAKERRERTADVDDGG